MAEVTLPPTYTVIEYPQLASGTGNHCNKTQNVTETCSDDKRDENLAKVEIIIQVIIFSLAVLGNSLVLIVLMSRR